MPFTSEDVLIGFLRRWKNLYETSALTRIILSAGGLGGWSAWRSRRIFLASQGLPGAIVLTMYIMRLPSNTHGLTHYDKCLST